MLSHVRKAADGQCYTLAEKAVKKHDGSCAPARKISAQVIDDIPLLTILPDFGTLWKTKVVGEKSTAIWGHGRAERGDFFVVLAV